jgi:hypothetical protein
MFSCIFSFLIMKIKQILDNMKYVIYPNETSYTNAKIQIRIQPQSEKIAVKLTNSLKKRITNVVTFKFFDLSRRVFLIRSSLFKSFRNLPFKPEQLNR